MPKRRFICLRPPGDIFLKFTALSIFDRLSTCLAIILRNYIYLHVDSQSTSNSKKLWPQRDFSEKWGFRPRLGHFAQIELLHNNGAITLMQIFPADVIAAVRGFITKRLHLIGTLAIAVLLLRRRVANYLPTNKNYE